MHGMFAQQEVVRLRALAASCRDLAQRISFRPDRETAQDQARRYDEAADRLEGGLTPQRTGADLSPRRESA